MLGPSSVFRALALATEPILEVPRRTGGAPRDLKKWLRGQPTPRKHNIDQFQALSADVSGELLGEHSSRLWAVPVFGILRRAPPTHNQTPVVISPSSGRSRAMWAKHEQIGRERHTRGPNGRHVRSDHNSGTANYQDTVHVLVLAPTLSSFRPGTIREWAPHKGPNCNLTNGQLTAEVLGGELEEEPPLCVELLDKLVAMQPQPGEDIADVLRNLGAAS